jgi:hypothetical protein
MSWVVSKPERHNDQKRRQPGLSQVQTPRTALRRLGWEGEAQDGGSGMPPSRRRFPQGPPWPPCASMDAPSPPCRPIPPTSRGRPNTSSKTLNPSLPTRGDQNENDSFDASNRSSNSGSSDRAGFIIPDRGAHRTRETRRRILSQSKRQRLIQPAGPVSDAGVARSRVPTCLFLNRARPTIEAAMDRSKACQFCQPTQGLGRC